MILLILIFYFLIQFKAGLVWLVLPASLFCDLWRFKPLGLTGLQTIAGILLLYLFFSTRCLSQGKYKIG